MFSGTALNYISLISALCLIAIQCRCRKSSRTENRYRTCFGGRANWHSFIFVQFRYFFINLLIQPSAEQHYCVVQSIKQQERSRVCKSGVHRCRTAQRGSPPHLIASEGGSGSLEINDKTKFWEELAAKQIFLQSQICNFVVTVGKIFFGATNLAGSSWEKTCLQGANFSCLEEIKKKILNFFFYSQKVLLKHVKIWRCKCGRCSYGRGGLAGV